MTPSEVRDEYARLHTLLDGIAARTEQAIREYQGMAVAPYGSDSDEDPMGACGGGECVWDNGTWFHCRLHLREMVGET